MPWLTFGVMLTLYLYNLPMVFALVWDGKGYGTGTGIFEPRFALRRADRRMTGQTKHINYEKISSRTLKVIPVKIATVVGARVLTRARLKRLFVHLEIGTGDAALTAQTVGAAYSLLCALGRARGDIQVTPNFKERILSGRAEVVFSLRPGDMAKAVCGYLLARIQK